MKWLLCISNDNYQASLEPRKFYEQLDDPIAEKLGMVRVIDESGEDYLYKADLFYAMPSVIHETINHALQAV